ncbi:hypothetical protein BJ875DRAFT_438291 [Amylocarpus encephaloides]|uniref:Uncharacterized protein n=1 Tax=Amylocarpus encephaloides TaxID=45428 RepID=A0A9P7YPK7_9HELO|nr:hypothetical protein BJ875DRAFT_438291 [Amylocarpus encephaloides]
MPGQQFFTRNGAVSIDRLLESLGGISPEQLVQGVSVEVNVTEFNVNGFNEAQRRQEHHCECDSDESHDPLPNEINHVEHIPYEIYQIFKGTVAKKHIETAITKLDILIRQISLATRDPKWRSFTTEQQKAMEKSMYDYNNQKYNIWELDYILLEQFTFTYRKPEDSEEIIAKVEKINIEAEAALEKIKAHALICHPLRDSEKADPEFMADTVLLHYENMVQGYAADIAAQLTTSGAEDPEGYAYLLSLVNLDGVA